MRMYSGFGHSPQRARMSCFKSAGQAPRFLSVHSRVTNLSASGRHHVKAVDERIFRDRAFARGNRPRIDRPRIKPQALSDLPSSTARLS
jgi:hypothetical protein